MKRLIAFLAAAGAVAVAAQPFPMKPDFQRGLGLSAETAAKVESIFAQQREQHQALRDKARAELAKVLTPEQLAKFDAMGPRRGPGGPDGAGPGFGPGGRGMHGYGMGPGYGRGMGPGYGMGPGMHGGWGGNGQCPYWEQKPEATKPSA